MEQKLIDFVLHNDFAWVYGVGIMYVNSPEERENVAGLLQEDGVMIKEIPHEDIEDEGCGCAELSEEAERGCRIFKVWKWNQEPLYIAYYE